MKLFDIKVGNILRAGAGFTCLKPGCYIVEKSNLGLYICCDNGEHYLDGQEDTDGNLVGLFHALPTPLAWS